MNQATSSPRPSAPDALAVAARWILGGVYVYMGLSKSLHPVDFLKILREYQLIDNHLLVIVVHRGNADRTGDHDVGLSARVAPFIDTLARGELLHLDLSRQDGRFFIVQQGK